MAQPILIAAGKHPVNVLGGHNTYVRTHARAALRAGYEPHLFCAGTEARVEQTDIGVIHTVRARSECRRGWSTPLHSPVLAEGMFRWALERNAPHLLHGFGMWAHSTMLAARKLQARGVASVPIASSYVLLCDETRGKFRGIRRHHGLRPSLHTAFEHAWSRLFMGRYERHMLTGSAVVLINYRSVRDALALTYPIADRLRLTPYTSESAYLNGSANGAHAGIPQTLDALGPVDAPLIVSVSRHDPRKGLDVLLAALALLRDRGVAARACLVGPGRLLAAHRRRAVRLGLADRVALPGAVPDPMAYLRHADVFVLPSLQEGSGSVSLIEAAQTGLPIVASDLDGIPEDVEHERSALLVPPGDPRALADALQRLVAQPDLRERLGRASREVFETRFSPERMSAELAKVYTELGFPA